MILATRQNQRKPEFEIADRLPESVRYLEHGWPSPLCRWHAHEDYELHLITAMKGKAVIGDYIGEFKTGDLFLVGPLLPHNWCSYEKQKPVTIRDRLVQFNHQMLLELCAIFPEYNAIKPMLNQAKAGIHFIDYDFQQANENLIKIRDKSGMQRINCFLDLLVSLAMHPIKKILSVGVEFTQMSELEETRISKIVDYVMHNYREKITTNSVAKYAGMSVNNFSRYFHNKTGNCFSEFVNKVRIGQACNLLLETNYPISSICYDTGFNNLSHFNRYFLRLKGVTPKNFRKTIRSKLNL